jgi:hypothetical protein
MRLVGEVDSNGYLVVLDIFYRREGHLLEEE